MNSAAPKCGSSDKRNTEYLRGYSPEKFFRYIVDNASPVILDVGAHRGESVLFFKEIFPESRIYSFEPDPENFLLLKKTCSQIKHLKEECIAINKAVCEKVGDVIFYRQGISHLGGLSPINKSSKDSLGYAKEASNLSISVESITLDQFAQEFAVSQVDILKIDVQGHEVDVLKGAQKILEKTLCCTVEVSFYDFYEQKSSLLLVEEEMKSAGMLLWDISKVSKNPKNFRTDWAELVYVKQDLI